MRHALLRLTLLTAAASLPAARATQAQPAGGGMQPGHVCRGVLSVNAANKEFGFVWVRLNPGDSADVWSAPGADVPPEAIPAKPPESARHTASASVSHINDFVGVAMQPPRGAPITLMVSESAHIMATPRQRSAIACTS
jgi:hypothetical protein